jgi:DNA transposition AAA+ family ATPase
MTNQVPDAEVEALRTEWRQWLASRPDVAPADVTPFTTLSDIAVRNFLNGSCRGGREICAEMRRVLTQAKAGDILQPGGSHAIVVASEQARSNRRVVKHHNTYETQTVQKIAEVCEYAAENARIGVITADFGVGKTEAIRLWRAGRGRKANCIIFEFDEFSSANKVDFVRQLGDMLGLTTPSGSQSGGRVFRMVCDHLREEPCLLVFDQCEMARTRIFQIIRQIWDRTHEAGVGVVILSAPVLMTRMLGTRVADLGALTSRVGIWAPLAGFTRSEMTAIVKQEGLGELDEETFDMWWRATGGSMRRLMRSIELLQAKHEGRKITTKTIAGVAGHLWGMQVAAA